MLRQKAQEISHLEFKNRTIVGWGLWRMKLAFRTTISEKHWVFLGKTKIEWKGFSCQTPPRIEGLSVHSFIGVLPLVLIPMFMILLSQPTSFLFFPSRYLQGWVSKLLITQLLAGWESGYRFQNPFPAVPRSKTIIQM